MLLLLLPSYTIFVSAQPAFKLPTSTSDQIIEMINKINESTLFPYLENLTKFGTRYTGTENCTKAANYFYATFKNMGINVTYHNWTFNKFSSQNVVATLPGTNKSQNATFIACGHFDTVAVSPGADDDGSGSAALLSLANIMKDYSFEYTIRFVAFTGEEVGSYGSFCYARDAYRHGDNIVAVLNIDMIGYANTTAGGNSIRLFYPARSQWVAEKSHDIVETYQTVLNMSIEVLPNYIGSDHQAFIDYGYDGVWIAHPDGYPWGHSQNDTANHINKTYYVKATRLMLTLLAVYARTPIDLQIILTQPKEGYLYVSGKALYKLDLGRAWIIGMRGTTFLFGKNTARSDVITNESIQFVIYCIDGNFQFGWPTTPPYECSILGIHYPLLGKHTLKVYAYTTSGDVATDEMDIHIFMLNSQFTKQRNT